jgi:branched-chain amino acid transport system permease protein
VDRAPFSRLWPAVLLLVLLAVPWLLGGYLVSMLIFAGIYGIAAVGLSLLVGYAGQPSLGHAAFLGVGAYTSALLATRFQLSPWLGLVAAVALTGLLAWPVGDLLLRLQGNHLALGTLGFGVIAHIVLLEWVELSRGPSGLGPIPPFTLLGAPLRDAAQFFYLMLAAVLLTAALAHNLTRSRAGVALRALREREVAAESSGLDTTALKLRVFVLSAALAGCAGSLYAHYVGYISPASFGFGVSVELLVMAAVGGLTRVWGALIGAALVLGLVEAIQALLPLALPQASGEHELILYGLLLIAVMTRLPEGVAGALANWLPGRQRGAGSDGPQPSSAVQQNVEEHPA